MTTGQAMDMPDGAGWWAYDEGLHKEVRHLLEWTDTGERLLYRWSSREFNNECTKESFRLSWPGVWYKLPPMPWEPQPPTTVQAITLSPQSVKVAIECIASERSATENMMDTWKETSDTYKKYAAQVAEYDTALAELNAIVATE